MYHPPLWSLMMPGLKTINLSIAGLVFLCVASCALSPQVIPVTPVLEAHRTGDSAAENIFIQVKDNRVSPDLGYRGGVYETAVISTAADITDSIQRGLASTLGAAGYEVSADGKQADLVLVIEIDSLAYTAQQKNVLWNIEIVAMISATVKRGSTEKSVQIQDRLTREFAKAPSDRENITIINNVINKALQRVIDNRSLFES